MACSWLSNTPEELGLRRYNENDVTKLTSWLAKPNAGLLPASMGYAERPSLVSATQAMNSRTRISWPNRGLTVHRPMSCLSAMACSEMCT
jgi:hypothetical protein